MRAVSEAEPEARAAEDPARKPGVREPPYPPLRQSTTMPTPAQYSAVGLTFANLVPVIMWLSQWPLQPLNAAQAGALAGLMLALGGLIHAIIQSYRGAE